jgi:hypothetical protein
LEVFVLVKTADLKQNGQTATFYSLADIPFPFAYETQIKMGIKNVEINIFEKTNPVSGSTAVPENLKW